MVTVHDKTTFLMLICSLFIKLTITSNDDNDFGSATLCMGNSTKGNSSYQNYDRSVLSLLSELALTSPPPTPRFFNATAGSSRDKAYGYYICWGDISHTLCQKCIDYATQGLSKQDFYHQCVGFGYYLDSNLCIVHYANKPVIEYMTHMVISMGTTGGKVANYLPYNRTLSTTIEELIEEAKIGNWSTTNLATRVVPVSGSNQEIHILAQCIPVISPNNCSRCLRELYDYVPKSCNGTQGGMVLHADCKIMFNNQSFIGAAAYASLIPSYLYAFVFSVMVFFL